jgi:hypothetical protein
MEALREASGWIMLTKDTSGSSVNANACDHRITSAYFQITGRKKSLVLDDELMVCLSIGV